VVGKVCGTLHTTIDVVLFLLIVVILSLAITNNKFLHDRPEETVFKLLIDCLRLRQEDVYKFEGDTMNGTIYNEERSSKRAFRAFLRKASRVEGLLPPWWSDEKQAECIRYGMTSSEFSLECAQEKSDIQETWGDTQMPMKLRMIGERVYGNTPGGSNSMGMMGMMLAMEDAGRSFR
jgi:splicing suppressor protein 51